MLDDTDQIWLLQSSFPCSNSQLRVNTALMLPSSPVPMFRDIHAVLIIVKSGVSRQLPARITI